MCNERDFHTSVYPACIRAIVLVSRIRLTMICVNLGSDVQSIYSYLPLSSPFHFSEWKMPRAGGLWQLLSSQQLPDPSQLSYNMMQKELRDPLEEGIL